jgi:hypothetical protein
MVAGMRQAPFWQGMEAIAPTLVYDAEVLGRDRSVPTERAAAVTAQTLIMDGGETLKMMPFMHATAEALATSIPNARLQTLAGQRHDADVKVLASALKSFFRED